MKLDSKIAVVSILVLLIGHGIGLFATPPEATQSEVGRILYLHVPTAWVALCTLLAAAGAAAGALWTGKLTWDDYLEAALEVGTLFCGLLVLQGSIWAKPTWHVWWTWDPRLTSTAILMASFVGVLLLRQVIKAPEKRMIATSVTTVLAAANVPVVYFSVEAQSLHQGFSSPDTVSAVMLAPLLVSLLGTTGLGTAMVLMRRRKSYDARLREQTPLPPPPSELVL